MDHFIRIYTSRAVEYQKMIADEDIDQNLLAAFQRFINITGKTVVDLGTGTGRLPVLFSNEAARTIGLDLHVDMLKENRRTRSEVGGEWELASGDMRACPLPAGCADVVTAGWAIGHFCGWYPQSWREEIALVLDEMHRLARRPAWLAILETLSTGSLTPQPPNQALGEYYRWLEEEWKFHRIEIQTDYQFSSVEEAIRKTEFFFGRELSEKIEQQQWSRLPEWTGMWIKAL